jgi:hypothetical protein
MDVEIRPGAALKDPDLQHVIDKQLRKSRRVLWSSVLIVPAIITYPLARTMLTDVNLCQHVYANYPSRAYSCKFGRWQWAQDGKGSLWNQLGLGVGAHMGWVRNYQWISLFDPDSAQPLGDFYLPKLIRHGIEREASRVRFAGDVNVGGIFSAINGAHLGAPAARANRWSGSLLKPLLTMTPDRPSAPYVPEPEDPRIVSWLGPWLADSPQPPARLKR